MREFYVCNDNDCFTGPYDLGDALLAVDVYITPERKKEVIDSYLRRQGFEFWFTYGFKTSLVTVWPENHK